MSITRVQSAITTGTSSTTIVTLPSSPTDGNTLIVTVSVRFNTNVSSVTSTGATWQQAADIDSGAQGITNSIWYASNVSGAGSSITVNLSGGTIKAVIVAAAEYSGLANTSPVDLTGTNDGSAQTFIGPTVGAMSTDEQLIIGSCGNRSNSDAWNTPTGGFTIVETDGIENGGSNFAAQGGFLEKITSTAETPSFTIPTDFVVNISYATTLASFKVPPPAKAANPDPANTATDILPSKILEWDDSANATEYEVFISTNPDPSSDSYGTVSESQFNPPDFDLNTTIYWRVDAQGGGGVVTGDVWQFTTIEELIPPSKTSTPTPENGATLVPPGIRLTWQPGQSQQVVFEPVSHNIYLSTDLSAVTNDDTDGTSFRANTENNFFTISKDILTPDTVHYWRVDSTDGGGLTKGDVWSFTTEPVIYDAPRGGDKIFGNVTIKGRVPPLNGVRTELHTDTGLIADGYTVAAENGQFVNTIPFPTQEPGTKIRAVSVAQASPDSEEVTIELVQAADEVKPPRTRSARRLNVDANTIGFWRMGKTVLAEAQTSSSEPKVNMNFDTGDIDDPPYNFTNSAGSETLKPEFTGVMTFYNFNLGSFSRISRSNDSSVLPIFSDGFTVQFRHRSQRGSPFAPDEGNHSILLSRNNGSQWRIFGGENAFTIINDQGTISFGQVDGLDYFKDWAFIEVRGKEMTSGDADSHYLELYVQGKLVEQGWATSSGSTDLFLGDVFSGGSFYAAQLDSFRIMEGDPFIERIGTNVEGTSALDMSMAVGCNIALANDDSVPFTHCARFNGTSGFMSNSDSALEPSPPFTVEGWVRINGDTGTSQIIVGKENFNTDGWRIYVDSNINIVYSCTDGSPSTIVGPQLLIDKWYYFAMVHDGTNLIGYLNGDQVDKITAGITVNTAQDFVIGRDSATSSLWLDGDVAEIRMSGVARTPWEIYNTYNAVDDPQIGFVHDKDTIAVWDMDSDPGRQMLVSSRSTTIPYDYLTSFTDTSDMRQYFPDINDSLLGSGSHSISVSGGDLILTNDHLSGEYSQVFVDTRAGLRFKGDFDFRIDHVGIPNRPQPWTTSSTDRSEIRMRTSSGVPAYIIYDEWFDGSNNRNRIWSFLHSTINTIEFGANVPSSIAMRWTREGNKWRAYYGLNGADPTILIGQETGPEDDCWLQIGNIIRAEYATTGTFSYAWNNIQMKGFNAFEGDGYLFHEVHGGSPRSEPLLALSPSGEKSRVFDGTADYIIVPATSEWDHQDISIECWFQASPLHNGVLINRLTPGAAGFSFGLGSDGYLAAEVIDDSGDSVDLSLGSVTSGVWHYGAFTYKFSTKTLKLYLDGRQIGEAVNPSMSGTHIGSADVHIGKHGTHNGEYFNGKLGAIKVSNVVRTPVEIFNHYKGSKVKDK